MSWTEKKEAKWQKLNDERMNSKTAHPEHNFLMEVCKGVMEGWMSVASIDRSPVYSTRPVGCWSPYTEIVGENITIALTTIVHKHKVDNEE
jgi:hypothetical protein